MGYHGILCKIQDIVVYCSKIQDIVVYCSKIPDIVVYCSKIQDIAVYYSRHVRQLKKCYHRILIRLSR